MLPATWKLQRDNRNITVTPGITTDREDNCNIKIITPWCCSDGTRPVIFKIERIDYYLRSNILIMMTENFRKFHIADRPDCGTVFFFRRPVIPECRTVFFRHPVIKYWDCLWKIPVIYCTGKQSVRVRTQSVQTMPFYVQTMPLYNTDTDPDCLSRNSRGEKMCGSTFWE